MILALLAVVSGCNSFTNASSPPPKLDTVGSITPTPVAKGSDGTLDIDALVAHISESTVAIVVENEEHVFVPNCTGVWVNTNLILTAAHCLEDSEHPAKNLVGYSMHFITHQEVLGLLVPPSAVHMGVVMKHSHAHDLILISTVGDAKTIPAHQVAKLTAANIPKVGSTVHSMGNVSQLYWTYARGYVSAYRTRLPDTFNENNGPFLQVSAPLWHGNSGGGLFNDQGELIAIVHSVSHDAPQITFNIPPIVIRRFLTGKP